MGAASLTTAAELELPGHGRVALRHSVEWTCTVAGPAAGPTLACGPAHGGDFKVLITAIPRHGRDTMGEEELAQKVRQAGEALLPTAQQKEIRLTRVGGPQAVGYLYHLTDASPERGSGDYREMNQGIVVVGPVLLSVTILTHSDDSQTLDLALAAVRDAVFTPAH